MRCRLPIVLALGAATLVAGCIPFLTGGPDCVNERRGVDVKAPLDDGSEVSVSLLDERDASSKRTALRRVVWWARLTRPRDELAAVHVHEGALAGGGRVLLTLDPRAANASPYPTLIVVDPYEYAGPVPWEDVFAALVRGDAYVDMHLGPDHPGAAQGPVTVLNPGNTNWIHSYCS